MPVSGMTVNANNKLKDIWSLAKAECDTVESRINQLALRQMYGALTQREQS